MRRALVVALVLGLLAGSLAAPVEAAKKKKKKKKPPVAAQPVPVEMVLWFNAQEGCAGPLTLGLTEATEGSNCGRNPFYGAAWGAGEAAGLATPYVFTAVEGLPFVLDGSKPIVATMQVSAYVSDVVSSGVGQTTLVGTLTGTTGGEAVELGTAEATYLVTPAQGIYEVPLEFDVKDFDKKTFTAFEIALEQRGTSVSHGHYRTLNPASKIAVPTLK